MTLAAKIKQNKNDPRKWIGRRASRCRKHENSVYYVNPYGQIGCIECDKPDDSKVMLRIKAHDGIWYEEGNGFPAEVPHESKQNIQPYSLTEQDGKQFQILPTHEDGSLMTWYEYDQSHGKPPGDSWESYFCLKEIMWHFYEGPVRPPTDLEVRYGKKR